MTTILGFAALLITDVPAVYELGAFSMLGIGVITTAALTGAPAALSILPLRSAPRISLAGSIERSLDRLLAALSAVVLRRKNAVLVTSLVVAVVAAILIPRIVIDTDYLSYFDEDEYPAC